jgi:tripartite-type tricarboxylate transporter receptor subunit TctC
MFAQLLMFLVALLFGASASAQTPFYQGKTVTIVVATKAGDVYDLYPRLLAQFLPKYIPGNPNVIILNVAGAAGLIATNQVYNLAKPDGLTLEPFTRRFTSSNWRSVRKQSSSGTSLAGSAVWHPRIP